MFNSESREQECTERMSGVKLINDIVAILVLLS